MVKSCDVLHDKSLNRLARHYSTHLDIILICLGMFSFISMLLNGCLKVVLLHQNLGNTCKSLYYKAAGRISPCNGRKVEKSQGYTCVFIVTLELESKKILVVKVMFCPIYTG